MPMTRVGRAKERGETQGFMKVLVDAESERILGAALLCIEGDEIVHSLLDVMAADASYKVDRARDAHPPDGQRADPDAAGQPVAPRAGRLTRRPSEPDRERRARSLVRSRDGVAFAAIDAARLEALIVQSCSRQIAAAAGSGANVIDIGDVESLSAALLRAALNRMPRSTGRDRRQLLVLSPGSIGRSAPDEVGRLLRRLRKGCGTDSLLVAGAALPLPPNARSEVDADRSTSYRYSVPRFESLVADAGWRHCQLWSDGQARYAVHVLERRDSRVRDVDPVHM